jgi:hypothetical protein
MSDRPKQPTIPEVKAPVHPGGQLVLRLSLRNQTNETMLVRPLLDDWVTDISSKGGQDEQIFSTVNMVDPAYIYLFPEHQIPGDASNTCQTMTITMPKQLRSGQVVKTCLRFPGLLEEGISIIAEIQPETLEIPTLEYPLEVTFPLQELDDKNPMLSYDQTTTGVFGLISGIIDLDRIPCRWLVAELIVMVSQTGEDYSRTDAGGYLLQRLQGTNFFHHVAGAVNSAKVPNWICETLSMSDKVLNRHQREERLLYIWERWLLSLVDSDVEVPETNKTIEAPLFLASDFAAKLGHDSDRWLGNFLLGLARLSPRLASNLELICANQTQEIPFFYSPTSNQHATLASYNLAAGLPGLDLLPVRWLVLELLLIFARQGDNYATTPAGETLLNQLRLTRFCKNGVLSFATAQAARWLTVSHTTASAFHGVIGSPQGQMGLLKFWEQWLWNIADENIQIPHQSVEPLVKKLGMDAEAWFLKILLGMSLISPRMATTLEAIAATAPEAPPEPPIPTVRIKDILSEEGSLQR